MRKQTNVLILPVNAMAMANPLNGQLKKLQDGLDELAMLLGHADVVPNEAFGLIGKMEAIVDDLYMRFGVVESTQRISPGLPNNDPI